MSGKVENLHGEYAKFGGAAQSSGVHDHAPDAPFQAAAEAFRLNLSAESRSTALVQLFDYLYDCRNNPRPPKEIEIAMAVFGRRSDFDTSRDSLVRGYVHRLRQRLDQFNLNRAPPHLIIPKGEYRLIALLDTAEQPVDSVQGIVTATNRHKSWKILILAMLCVSIVCWATIFWNRNHQNQAEISKMVFWKPLMESDRDITIVVRDHYMIGLSNSNGDIYRLLEKEGIHSGRDLLNYQVENPKIGDTMHDRDIYRVPAPLLLGAIDILHIFDGMGPRKGKIEILPQSKLTQDHVDQNNVIYVRFTFDQDFLTGSTSVRSNFTRTKQDSQIQDLKSGRIYSFEAEQDLVTGHMVDYGYIAQFAGPRGQIISIISAINDEGLKQMMRILADPKHQRPIKDIASHDRGFEALYQINSRHGVIGDSKLLVARMMEHIAD